MRPLIGFLLFLCICATIQKKLTESDFDFRVGNHYNYSTEYTEEDITWLSKNIYFEARNQEIEGQFAVLFVTLNRVADNRFPNTVKEVVLQAQLNSNLIPVRDKCQFSWYCDGKKDIIDDMKTFAEIRKMVLTFLQSNSIMYDITNGATHYHADYVHPKWAKDKTKTITIGNHIFYRWEKRN